MDFGGPKSDIFIPKYIEGGGGGGGHLFLNKIVDFGGPKSDIFIPKCTEESTIVVPDHIMIIPSWLIIILS